MLCLFDLDGTLIDSERGIAACLAHACAGVGAPPPDPAQLRRFIGPPLQHGLAELLGDDPQRIGTAVALYRQRYDAVGWLEHDVYPGIEAAVADLGRAGHRLAVVTSKVQARAERIVGHLDFGHAFERVYGPGPDGGTGKAELVERALAELGDGEAAMIGDRRFDIEGAHAHGIRAIGVLWGFGSPGELEAAGAHALARTPSELPGLLDAPDRLRPAGAGLRSA